MKRTAAVLCLSILMILFAAPVAYGAQFQITDSSPEDGQTGMSVDNMGVKVYFNKNVFGEENRKVNQNACKLVDRKGKEVKSSVYFNPDDHKVIMVLADSNSKIKGDAEYTLIIDESFTADDGSELGDTQEISFRTLNPQTSMTVSMVMMGVMIVAMVFFASKEAKKTAQEGAKTKKEKVNPYKEAKRTGKSVEEIVAKQEKKKEKEEQAEERKAAREAKRKRQKAENKVEIASDNIRVSGPRPISAAGSTYKTGRAEAARKAKEEAEKRVQAKKQGPKRSQNPNKNKGNRKKQ